MKPLPYLYTVLCLFLTTSCWAETAVSVRADTTEVMYYLDRPEAATYPLVVILQGSECLKVSHKYASYIDAVNRGGAAVLRVEKPGLTEDTEIGSCPPEYLERNTPQQRVLDILGVLAELRVKDKGWNGKVALVGGSEGAIVAAMTAPMVCGLQSVALLSGGSGRPFYEEVFLACAHQMIAQGMDTEEIEAKIIELHAEMVEIINNPQADGEWLSDGELARNSHLWWTRAVRLDLAIPTQKIQAPILILHGRSDPSMSVEGAMDLKKRLEEGGKKDVELHLYDGGHAPPEESVLEVLDWVLGSFECCGGEE